MSEFKLHKVHKSWKKFTKFYKKAVLCNRYPPLQLDAAVLNELGRQKIQILNQVFDKVLMVDGFKLFRSVEWAGIKQLLIKKMDENKLYIPHDFSQTPEDTFNIINNWRQIIFPKDLKVSVKIQPSPLNISEYQVVTYPSPNFKKRKCM